MILMLMQWFLQIADSHVINSSEFKDSQLRDWWNSHILQKRFLPEIIPPAIVRQTK